MKLKYIAFVLVVLLFIVIAGCVSANDNANTNPGSSTTSTPKPAVNRANEPIIGTWTGAGTFTVNSTDSSSIIQSFPTTISLKMVFDKDGSWYEQTDVKVQTFIMGEIAYTNQSEGRWVRVNETTSHIFYKITSDEDKETWMIPYHKKLDTIALDFEYGTIYLNKVVT